MEVSFQRFRVPPSGLLEALPSSLGALPVGLTRHGTMLLPLDAEEAFWIGASDLPGSLANHLRIEAQLRDGTALSLTTPDVTVPPDHRFFGFPRPDGLMAALSRSETEAASGLKSLRISVRKHASTMARSAQAVIHVVGYKIYAERTQRSEPDPLDPDAQFSRVLLP